MSPRPDVVPAPVRARPNIDATGPAEGWIEELERRSCEAGQRLLESLSAQARLSAAGWASTRQALAASGRARRMIRRLGPTPEITRPVFVTGLHRSGTTVLHRLLALHPALRAPDLWEQLEPTSDRDPAELIARAVDYVADYHRAAPSLPGIHPLAADQPDECHRLTGVTLLSEIYELRYHVPSYGRWLSTQDISVAYRAHRALLGAISRRRPIPRAVLKCPYHLTHLDELFAVYPDAYVVVIHRDPVQTVPSSCSLGATIRRARSDDVDLAALGQYWIDRTDLVVRTVLQRPADPRVLDVRYPDLIADPGRTLARIFTFVDVDPDELGPPEVRAAMAESQARVRHQYEHHDFGLDRSELADRYRAYRAAFELT